MHTHSAFPIAEKICTALEDQISDFREDLIKELRTELLDVQKGKVVALDLQKGQRV